MTLFGKRITDVESDNRMKSAEPSTEDCGSNRDFSQMMMMITMTTKKINRNN
jgi:hypothetical protein